MRRDLGCAFAAMVWRLSTTRAENGFGLKAILRSAVPQTTTSRPRNPEDQLAAVMRWVGSAAAMELVQHFGSCQIDEQRARETADDEFDVRRRIDPCQHGLALGSTSMLFSQRGPASVNSPRRLRVWKDCLVLPTLASILRSILLPLAASRHVEKHSGAKPLNVV